MELVCNACGKIRQQSDLDCIDLYASPIAATFFRFCKDNEKCRQIALKEQAKFSI